MSLPSDADIKTVSVRIPVASTLDWGLNHDLKKIARGESDTGIVLALRDVAQAASAIGKDEILGSLAEMLETLWPTNPWIIEKTIDGLLQLGPNRSYAEASQYLSQLGKIFRSVGRKVTADQLAKLVLRGDSYSRAGVNALAIFFNEQPEHANRLELGKLFRKSGHEVIAWYCDFRTEFLHLSSIEMFSLLVSKKPVRLRYGRLELLRTDETKEFWFHKWPNRGDVVLLDFLIESPENVEN